MFMTFTLIYITFNLIIHTINQIKNLIGMTYKQFYENIIIFFFKVYYKFIT